MNIEIPEFPELTFDEKYHIYKLNGDKIPSVSKIMKPLSQALYSEVNQDVLDAAAARGTAVHNAIENYILFGITDIPEEYAAYFEAFKDWWKENKPEVLATETRVYHKSFRYAGTADLLAVIGGEKVLIDYKTSSTVNKMLTGVQTEAYAKAYESHGIKFDRKMILHLTKDGKYTEHSYPAKDAESMETFSALLTVYAHIKKYGGKG